MKFELGKRKKIVIKIGSSLLIEDGKVREEWLNNLSSDISKLVAKKVQVIIVSSGSVALGRGFIKCRKEKLSVEEKQAASAIGQIQLMSFYRDFFKRRNLDVAQILLTLADCNSRGAYLNAQNAIKILLKNNIIPIINENDAISLEEIKIGDNDRLAARVAQMISADLLILFSDIDGLYDKNPKTNKDAILIQDVKKITRNIEKMASGTDSKTGTGGMITKLKAAKMAGSSACDTIITNGLINNPLEKLLNEKQKHTIFHGKKNPTKSREKWLYGLLNAKGKVVVDKCAKEALLSKKTSLLSVGITKVTGKFKEGDAIFINDEEGKHIASGISNYSSLEAKKILGKNSQEIIDILGERDKTELVHIDNMTVIK